MTIQYTVAQKCTHEQIANNKHNSTVKTTGLHKFTTKRLWAKLISINTSMSALTLAC